MPEFAADLGHGDPGFSYSMLLAADAAGALTAGHRAREPRPAAGAAAHGVRAGDAVVPVHRGFAVSEVYPLVARAAVRRRIPRSVVQRDGADAGAAARARRDSRPRDRPVQHGSHGMRAFSGVTVGIGGSLIGIHWSLALSALALLAVTLVLDRFRSTRSCGPAGRIKRASPA